MGRTLPPAKRGQPHAPQAAATEPPAAREMTSAERAKAAAGVAEAYARAGRDTPAKRAAAHQAAQQHVPRMIDWYNRNAEYTKGHSDPHVRTPWTGGTEVYVQPPSPYTRPAPEAHS